MANQVIAVSVIERKIFFIRGHKVMLDHDLAQLYQVPTKALNQAVKRNRERFPAGFMFRLTMLEMKQLVTICDQFQNLKHSYQLPLAFTEYGVAMLSSVLRSKRAVSINIQIIQAFIRLKTLISSNEGLRKKIAVMEKKYDKRFAVVFDAIEKLLDCPEKPVNVKGFGNA